MNDPPPASSGADGLAKALVAVDGGAAASMAWPGPRAGADLASVLAQNGAPSGSASPAPRHRDWSESALAAFDSRHG